MKVTITGTLEEWMTFDPDAMLINRKINFMSNGCCIINPRKDRLQPTTYTCYGQPSNYSNYELPYFQIGGCPYIVKGKHDLFVTVCTIYGSGGPYPIAKSHWDDPNWERIEKIEDCLLP
jgi:hypothetical protein